MPKTTKKKIVTSEKSLQKQKQDVDLKILKKLNDVETLLVSAKEQLGNQETRLDTLEQFLIKRIPLEDKSVFWKEHCLDTINKYANVCFYPSNEQIEGFAKKKLDQQDIPTTHPSYKTYFKHVVKMASNQRNRKKSDLKISVVQSLKEVLQKSYDVLEELETLNSEHFKMVVTEWKLKHSHVLELKSNSQLNEKQASKIKSFYEKAIKDRIRVLTKKKIQTVEGEHDTPIGTMDSLEPDPWGEEHLKNKKH